MSYKVFSCDDYRYTKDPYSKSWGICKIYFVLISQYAHMGDFMSTVFANVSKWSYIASKYISQNKSSEPGFPLEIDMRLKTM